MASVCKSTMVRNLIRANQTSKKCFVQCRSVSSTGRLLQKDAASDSKCDLPTRSHNTRTDQGRIFRSASMESTMNTQSLQGEPVHYFTPPSSRDVMSKIHDAQAEMRKVKPEKTQSDSQQETTGSDEGRPQGTVPLDTYEHTSHVSLYSCMQSNVPHPYNQGPTYLNMPSGGHSHQQKYISGMLNDSHPSRQLSTSCQSLASPKPERD